MAVYILLGTILFAASMSGVQAAVTTIYSKGGLQIFRSPTTATNCTLYLPDKAVCKYKPGTTPVPQKACNFPYDAYNSNYCNFQVDVTNIHLSGVYRLEYVGRDGVTRDEIFNLYLRGGGVPTDELTVAESESIYLRIVYTVPRAMNCDVLYPNGTREVLTLNSSPTSSNHWGKQDECGLQINGVSKEHGGDWTLVITSDGTYIYEQFQVAVTPQSITSTRPLPPIEWPFGGSGVLSLTHTNSMYCEIWNARQELVLRTMASCFYVQNIVTDVHEGNWTIVFGLKGQLSEKFLTQEIKVMKAELKTNVTESEIFEGGLDLLCRLSFGTVSGCSFTRPDGVVFLPTEGLGNTDYSYFGDGFRNGDCGLTIHQMQEVDKGWWNCSVTSGSTTRNSFLNVSATDVSEPDHGEANHVALVTVQKDSTVYLSCRDHSSLEYCWFRHPSGYHLRFTTRTVSLDGLLESSTPRYYVYDDTLHMGVCGVRVSTANVTADSGEWTCHLGVPGIPGEDRSVPIAVRVSETDVISLEKAVVFSGGSAVLKCYSIPTGMPLQYCRFIRPDGKGFNIVAGNNNAVLGRYHYEAEGLEKGECGLKINEETAADEDFGKWTCVAKLQGKAQEGQDFVTVTRNVEQHDDGLSTGAIVGIALGGAAVLLIVVGLIIFIIRRKSA